MNGFLQINKEDCYEIKSLQDLNKLMDGVADDVVRCIKVGKTRLICSSRYIGIDFYPEKEIADWGTVLFYIEEDGSLTKISE